MSFYCESMTSLFNLFSLFFPKLRFIHTQSINIHINIAVKRIAPETKIHRKRQLKSTSGRLKPTLG